MGRIFQIYILIFLNKAYSTQPHEAGGSRLFSNDPELTTIPKDIMECYTNMKLWDRYGRLPTNVESLVALLRKAELHPAVKNWTPGRLAANLIHKFRFDGIKYDRCVDTSTGALPLVLDLQSEVPKMALIWQFIEGRKKHYLW